MTAKSPTKSIRGKGFRVCFRGKLGVAIFDATGRSPACQRRAASNSSARLNGEVIAFLGLVIASVFGCFLYYPPREQIFKEMRFVHTEVFSAANSGQFEAALYWAPIYEDWNRKLMVSEYLRGRPVTRYQRMKSRILSDRLERLKHELEDQKLESCREMVIPMNRSFERLKSAFRPQED